MQQQLEQETLMKQEMSLITTTELHSTSTQATQALCHAGGAPHLGESESSKGVLRAEDEMPH